MYGYVLAILASVTWGLSYVLEERAMQSMTPWGLFFILTTAQAVLAAPFVLMDPARHLAPVWTGSAGFKWLLLGAVTTGFVAGILILTSIYQLNATVAAMIEISYPLFIALFGWLFFQHAITWTVALGGALIFSGSWIIIVAGR